MSEKKPRPPQPATAKRACPVCGQPSYSAAGIHPQCALVQADAPRKQRLLEEKKAEAVKKANEGPVKQPMAKKRCPKCKAELHVRKKQCICGHSFKI